MRILGRLERHQLPLFPGPGDARLRGVARGSRRPGGFAAVTRCQVCGRRLGLSKAGAIPHHHVKGVPCPGKGHPPIEQDDARLESAWREAAVESRAATRAYLALIDRRANYIDQRVYDRMRETSRVADRLKRRLDRHRGWPARFERQMERDGWGDPPPDYLLVRAGLPPRH